MGWSCAVDARLNERISGMDGQHVDVFNDYVRADYLRIKPPRGESFIEQMERLRSFLDDVAARHPDGVVLAVSHENPIVAALTLRVMRRNKRRAATSPIASGLNCSVSGGAISGGIDGAPGAVCI